MFMKPRSMLVLIKIKHVDVDVIMKQQGKNSRKVLDGGVQHVN